MYQERVGGWPGLPEDYAGRRSQLVLGQAAFVDDVPLEGGLVCAFARSPLAHAEILEIELDAARSVPGVVGAFTAPDLNLPPRLAFAVVDEAFARPPLAVGRVRFAGEAMAVVVARSRAAAEDGAAAVEAHLEPLPALLDPASALSPGAQLLFPGVGTNVAYEVAIAEGGDPLEGAQVVVTARIHNQRLAPSPMEPNAVLARPDGLGGLDLLVSTQSPFQVRDFVADCLGLEEDQVRCRCPFVGGAFGGKLQVYPEQAVVAALALKLGCEVRWVEDRSENLVAMTHGRAQDQEFWLGASTEGEITGIRVEVLADAGAYPGQGSFLPQLTGQMITGPYRIPKVSYHSRSLVTNTTPTASYRGAGRPEAAYLLERAMDMLAQRLQIDPAEVRRRNFIPDSAFPFTTATGLVYDSGDYVRALDQALDLAGYPLWREEQRRRRGQGPRALGIGLASYVEMTAMGSPTEHAQARVGPDGAILVAVGTQDSGQGHAETYSAIAAKSLAVSPGRIRVLEGDTGKIAMGDGSSTSRSVQLGGSAVLEACATLAAAAREQAAAILGVPAPDLAGDDAGFFSASRQERVSWSDLGSLPDPPRAEADSVADPSYPSGTHLAVVEVDLETGQVNWLRHWAVDDPGRVVSPALARAQIAGGTVQGAGQALSEEVVFDGHGSPRTTGFTDYELLSPAEVPPIDSHLVETPSPNNPLGAKGIGESGTVAATPAVMNAILDALAQAGVSELQMPAHAARVWGALQAARDP